MDLPCDCAAAVETIIKHRITEVIRLLGIEQIAEIRTPAQSLPKGGGFFFCSDERNGIADLDVFVPVVVEDNVAVATGHGDHFKVRLRTVVDAFLLHDQTHFVAVIAVVVKRNSSEYTCRLFLKKVLCCKKIYGKMIKDNSLKWG